jgi:N-methylhydantoinase B
MLMVGDRVRISTGGGGGYGDPQRRDRDRICADVMRGYVSPEAARDIYGLNEPTART